MEQTFNDLLRERAGEDRGLFDCALWMFVETSAGIIKEQLNYISMQKSIIRVALVTAGILLIPFFGNIYVDGWNWHWYTFVLAGTLLFGAGLTYEFVAKRMSNKAYKFAVGLAVGTAFILSWGNMVRVSESENPANLMYYGVLAVGVIGALIARFEPRGMARALFAMALAQMLVPVIVLIISNPDTWSPPGVLGVFVLNSFFALLFVGSALLFRHAAREHN
ncbi:MAG: hypothetical protein V1794_14940 [Candidatus Glassbacteria bacterium]